MKIIIRIPTIVDEKCRTNKCSCNPILHILKRYYKNSSEHYSSVIAELWDLTWKWGPPSLFFNFSTHSNAINYTFNSFDHKRYIGDEYGIIQFDTISWNDSHVDITFAVRSRGYTHLWNIFKQQIWLLAMIFSNKFSGLLSFCPQLSILPEECCNSKIQWGWEVRIDSTRV